MFDKSINNKQIISNNALTNWDEFVYLLKSSIPGRYVVFDKRQFHIKTGKLDIILLYSVLRLLDWKVYSSRIINKSIKKEFGEV